MVFVWLEARHSRCNVISTKFVWLEARHSISNVISAKGEVVRP